MTIDDKLPQNEIREEGLNLKSIDCSYLVLSLIAIAVGYVCYLYYPRTIENATVINKKQVSFSFLSDYGDGPVLDSETQTAIEVDKYDKCLRGQIDLKPLNIGDKVKKMKYRLPLWGECDIITGYER